MHVLYMAKFFPISDLRECDIRRFGHHCTDFKASTE